MKATSVLQSINESPSLEPQHSPKGRFHL